MRRAKKAVLASFVTALGFLCLAGRTSAADFGCDPNDPECVPPPSLSTVMPAGVATIPPGHSSCCPLLFANQSAGIAGIIASTNGSFCKLPKVSAWWDANGTQPLGKLTVGRYAGNFQLVLNKSNGYAPYFPGYFQFCIWNPACNATIQVSASCVTY